jgi:hypothetical protein
MESREDKLEDRVRVGTAGESEEATSSRWLTFISCIMIGKERIARLPKRGKSYVSPRYSDRSQAANVNTSGLYRARLEGVEWRGSTYT